MNQDMDRQTLVRKKTIEKYVEMLYGRFTHLFPERLVDLKAKAVEKFLNTNLSYDDIIQILLKAVEERDRIYEAKKEGKIVPTEEQVHYDLNDLFDCRITDDCLHMHVVPKSVREDMAQAGGPTSYLNNVVAPKLDDALDKVVDILNTKEQGINTVAAISPTLRLAQKLFVERGFDVGETHDERFVQMFGDSRIFTATIPREKLIKLQEEKKNKPIEVVTEPVTTPVVQEKPKNEISKMFSTPTVQEKPKNELSEMFSTPEPVKENKVQENDIHKQLVKKDTKPNNNQTGAISLFNISLALLIMTGLILIAMILNVVLK